MGVFLKVLGEDLRSMVPLVLWVTISFAVAITGPFGSYGAFDLGERALFWTPVIGLAILISSVIRAFVFGSLRLYGTLPGTALITLLNCLLLCPVLYLVFQAVLPPLFAKPAHVTEIILLVSSISLGVCALRQVNSAEPAAQPPAVTPVTAIMEPPPLPRLMRRIEPALQGPVWAMTVRDHYVDVQTARGKTSLLMRFSDAITEVEPVPGAQVHRSHWVAWAGVGSVCREGGKMMLHLKSGHQIPVSRANRDKVDAQFPPAAVFKDVAA